MKLSNILGLGFLSIATAAPLEVVTAVPNTQFEITSLVNHEGYLIAQDFLFGDEIIMKRDEGTVASIITKINDTGIIWSALDLVANNLPVIENVLNQTIGGLSSINSSFQLNLNFSIISQAIDVPAIIEEVINSGLVTSVLNGVLLDEDFRPTLVDLIYRIVISNEDGIKYLLDNTLAKRQISESELIVLKRQIEELQLSELVKRATTGSFGNLVSNVIAGVLKSNLVTNIANETLHALNDTGVGVYVVKRFLSTEKYVNMTGALIEEVGSHINFTSLLSLINITQLITAAGASINTDNLISLLLGDISGFTSSLGKYASAVGDIISDLEQKGLFVELNNLIFPSSTSTSSSRLSVISTTQEGKSGATSALATSMKQASSSSSSKAGVDSINTSSISKLLMCLQTFLIGGFFFIF